MPERSDDERVRIVSNDARSHDARSHDARSNVASSRRFAPRPGLCPHSPFGSRRPPRRHPQRLAEGPPLGLGHHLRRLLHRPRVPLPLLRRLLDQLGLPLYDFDFDPGSYRPSVLRRGE